jgi:hypothetical protein
MRVLLCDHKTGLYYQSPDHWTNEAAQAKDFRSSAKAVVYAQECGLAEVEVFVDFDDPEYNVRLPIRHYLTQPSRKLEPEPSAA